VFGVLEETTPFDLRPPHVVLLLVHQLDRDLTFALRLAPYVERRWLKSTTRFRRLRLGKKSDALDDGAQQDIRNLPSRVFYGVSTNDAISLRLLGVPRAAAEPMANVISRVVQAGENPWIILVRSDTRADNNIYINMDSEAYQGDTPNTLRHEYAHIFMDVDDEEEAEDFATGGSCAS
jgi:hypothetical protein